MLGFLGYGHWPLLAVFLVPLWWGLERTRGIAGAALLGLVFGAVAYAGGHPWLLELVDVFLAGDFAIGFGLWLLYGAWFAAGFALYGALFAFMRERGTGFGSAALPAWLLIEWLQPLLFPVHAGAGLVGVTPVVQIVDLGGPLVATALVLVTNLAVFETLRWLREGGGRPRTTWLACTAALLASLAYGAVRTTALEHEIENAPALRVGIVQANLGLLEKRTRAVVGHRKHLEQTRQLLADGEVDLVVWPETAYAQAIRGPLPVSGRLIQQELRVPLLFGAPIIDAPGPEPVQSNAAMLIDRDGLIRSAYRKNLLIPLAESVPLAGWWPGLEQRLPHAQTFTAATNAPPLVLDAWKIAVPICYEAVRPSFTRAMLNEGGANLIVTLANDAWFGDSREPRLHLGLARMRAIEHRRYLVRATNSGISAVVDPLGRIVARTGVLERANLRATVHRMEDSTLYTRFGNWPGPAAAFVLLFALTFTPNKAKVSH